MKAKSMNAQVCRIQTLAGRRQTTHCISCNLSILLCARRRLVAARQRHCWFLQGIFAYTYPKVFDAAIYPHVEPLNSKMISSTTALTTYGFTAPPSLCNNMGNLHGGAASTLFDLLTTISIAPLSTPSKFRYAGVSRTLNCTYLRPVAVGTRVRIECEVVSLGRNLCTIRGVMRKAKDELELLDEESVGKGDILVLCEHGKASIDPPLETQSEPKL